MGGGFIEIIRQSYYNEIKNKQPITNCFVNEDTIPITKTILDHIGVICHILINENEDLDKSEIIQAIQEIKNNLNSIENK